MSNSIENISEFISDINCEIDRSEEEERARKRNRRKYEWYYRGECAKYIKPLNPSLFRSQKKRKHEAQMLIELITHQPDEFLKYSSVISHWCLAQHHKLPTRLLDITRNSLVALYFTCISGRKDGSVYSFKVPSEMVKSFNSDTISVVSNFAKLKKGDQDCLIKSVMDEDPNYTIKMCHNDAAKRLYGLIGEEKPRFDERIRAGDLFKIFVVNPLISFNRVRIQMGAFLISAFPYDYGEISRGPFKADEFLKNKGVGTKIRREFMEVGYTINMATVRYQDKAKIRNELNRIGITNEYLFPSLDSFAEAIGKKDR